MAPIPLPPHLLLATLLTLLAGCWDLRWQRIPNWLTYPGVLVGLCLGLLPGTEPSWAAALVGFALGLLPALLLFAGGALGGGDTKLLAAIGALLGYPLIFDVLFLAVCVGMLLGLLGLLGLRGHEPSGMVLSWQPTPGHRHTQPFRRLRNRRISLGVAIAIATLAVAWVPALRITPPSWALGG